MNLLKNYLKKQPFAENNTAAIAYLAGIDHIAAGHPEIAHAIVKELSEQRSNLKLIASENYSSYAVQLAMGNLLTDKYAEGFPHHRYYAGCENVDTIEEIAVNQLKKLFNAEHAYVQPHSGADANLVAFWSILFHKIQKPELEKLGNKRLDELTDEEHEKIRQLMVNQKVMGMSLNSGGHLTHGYRHNASSKMMKASFYDVDPSDEKINYTLLAEQVKREKPTILLAGYSAHPCRLNFAKFREIADSVKAVLMVDMAHFSGLVAGKAFTGDYDPVPFADIVTSTTHKTLRGPRGGIVLCKKEYAEIIDRGCPLILGGPLPHVLAAKAIAFKEANAPVFQTYASNIVKNAESLAKELMTRGIRLVSGGTENHLLILDVTQFNLTGKQAEAALREAGVTTNRNSIPFDKNGPLLGSGVRIGTPAVTTLGMGPDEMVEIADIIIETLAHTKAEPLTKGSGFSKSKQITEQATLNKSRERVKDLLHRHPLYPEIELI